MKNLGVQLLCFATFIPVIFSIGYLSCQLKCPSSSNFCETCSIFYKNSDLFIGELRETVVFESTKPGNENVTKSTITKQHPSSTASSVVFKSVKLGVNSSNQASLLKKQSNSSSSVVFESFNPVNNSSNQNSSFLTQQSSNVSSFPVVFESVEPVNNSSNQNLSLLTQQQSNSSSSVVFESVEPENTSAVTKSFEQFKQFDDFESYKFESDDNSRLNLPFLLDISSAKSPTMFFDTTKNSSGPKSGTSGVTTVIGESPTMFLSSVKNKADSHSGDLAVGGDYGAESILRRVMLDERYRFRV